MSKLDRKNFTSEQLAVIDNTKPLEDAFTELTNIASNEELKLSRKRSLMFAYLITFMSKRKTEFQNVGIKTKICDTLVKNEIKTLNQTIKGVQNVIS